MTFSGKEHFECKLLAIFIVIMKKFLKKLRNNQSPFSFERAKWPNAPDFHSLIPPVSLRVKMNFGI